MNKLTLPLLLIIILLIQCTTTEVDRCAEKVENGVFRKPILPEADAWIIDEPDATIQFTGGDGSNINVLLRSNLSDSVDVECPDVSFERHLYEYQVSDTSRIIAMERTSQFSVYTEGTGGTFQDMIGRIDHLENLYLDARYVDEVSLGDARFIDLLLVRHNPSEEYLIDSVYFLRGVGLVSFQYQNTEMVRQF